MNELRFYIDNKKSNPPEEYRGIELELNFENIDEIRVAISQTKFTFVNENAELLRSYLEAGVNGGLGIYWGVPFRIELDTQILFDGYLDLVDEADFSCDKVICKTKEAHTLDWMEEVADGFSFDGLFADGFITASDFINIPYIQSDIPDYKQAALFFLYAFVIERELAKIIKDVADVSADLAGVFSTAAGVIKAIFLVGYLIVLMIALFNIIKEMLAELISPVRYHKGMMVLKHFEAACAYLGFTFQSSLFQKSIPSNIYDINGDEIPSGYWSDELWLPKKNKAGFKKNTSSSQMGYFNGTFGEFIRVMEAKYHGRFTIINKVFSFERSDYGASSKVYKIPDVYRKNYGTNASELTSNYLVQFAIDNLDLNTADSYNGTNAQNYITHIVSDPNKVSLLKGLKQPPILVARGVRKDKLTRVEEYIQDFLKVIDKILTPIYKIIDVMIDALDDVVKAINAIIKAINLLLPSSKELKLIKVPALSVNKTSLADTIGNRLGMLLLSSDFTGEPKSILITGSGWNVKIAKDNGTRNSAANLWNKYHFIESMVPNKARPAGNQMYIYEIPVIPFCLNDYYRVRGLDNGNKGEAAVISPTGKPAKILSLKWNIYRNKAFIRYGEEKLFDNNLKETLLINEGN